MDSRPTCLMRKGERVSKMNFRQGYLTMTIVVQSAHAAVTGLFPGALPAEIKQNKSQFLT